MTQASVTPQLWIGVGNPSVALLARVAREYTRATFEDVRVPAAFVGLRLEPALDGADAMESTPELRLVHLDARLARRFLLDRQRAPGDVGADARHATWLPGGGLLRGFDVEPSGASQIRFIGRLASALQAGAVEQALRSAASAAAASAGADLRDGLRVTLLAAAAGGASGMLLDVAQLAASVLDIEHMEALLVLPESAAEGPRALPNAYAQLFEWHLVRSGRKAWQPAVSPRGYGRARRHPGVPDVGFVVAEEPRDGLVRALSARLHAELHRAFVHVADRLAPLTTEGQPPAHEARTLAGLGAARLWLQALTSADALDALVGSPEPSVARSVDRQVNATHGLALTVPDPAVWRAFIQSRLPALAEKLLDLLKRDPPDRTEPDLVALGLGYLAWQALPQGGETPPPPRIAAAIEMLRREAHTVLIDLLREASAEGMRDQWRKLLQSQGAEFILGVEDQAAAAAWRKRWAAAAPYVEPFKWWQVWRLISALNRLGRSLSREVVSNFESEERAALQAALTSKGPDAGGHLISHVARHALLYAVGLEGAPGDAASAVAEPPRNATAGARQDVPDGAAAQPLAAPPVASDARPVPPGVAEIAADLRTRLRQEASPAARAEWDALASVLDVAQRRARLEAWLVHDFERRAREGRVLLVLDPQRRAHDVLHALALACAPRVFVSPSEHGDAHAACVALLPRALIYPGGRGRCEETLRQAVRELLHCSLFPRQDRGSELWLYHEDRQRDPSQLRNLTLYQDAYSQAPEQAIFAADRRLWEGATGDELGAPRSKPPLSCGNLLAGSETACDADVASVPRAQRCCPKCRQPIRTRCGNASCARDLPLEDPRSQDKVCPGCGGFNHGAWWRCARHGKVDVLVPIDKPRCPRCVREHHEDPARTGRDEIARRPDLAARLACWNCLREQDEGTRDAADVFEIAPELQPFVRHGVNGHDWRRFEEAAGVLVDKRRCPRCDAWLVPVHLERERAGARRETCAVGEAATVRRGRPQVTRPARPVASVDWALAPEPSSASRPASESVAQAAIARAPATESTSTFEGWAVIPADDASRGVPSGESDPPAPSGSAP